MIETTNELERPQRILGLSGKKQSGKNTFCNFVVGMEMNGLGIIREGFMITDKGELWVHDLHGDDRAQGVFDLNRNNAEMIKFLDDYVHPFIKVYSFADILKKDVCMKVLGLTHKQCYGTDDDKNSLTHLMWENMPGVVTSWPDDKLFVSDSDEIVYGRLGEYYTKNAGVIYHVAGQMTAREVLQYVGTEVFRKMYSNVWVDALIRQIKAEDSLFALVSDVRFPNEVDGIQAAGGKVVRLNRNPHPEDKHFSEIALDEDKFDWSRFDSVIDNKDMNIAAQNDATHKLLDNWQWAPQRLDKKEL